MESIRCPNIALNRDLRRSEPEIARREWIDVIVVIIAIENGVLLWQ